MFLKAAQHHSKCYCYSVGSASTCCDSHVNCFKRKTTGSGSVFSVATTKSKQAKQIIKKRTAERSKQKTDFVKINRKAVGSTVANKNRRGLGHSAAATTTATNFSRRNSAATTVTFSTPCATPARTHSSNAPTPSQTTPSSSPITILKATPVTMAALGDKFRALSVSTKSDFGGALQHEYTEQRRYYESAKQLMELISSQSDKLSSLNIVSGDSRAGDGGCIDPCASDVALNAEHLRALQQFRLQNADECFSVHRQLDLHLPAQRKELERCADERHTRQLWSNLMARTEVARSEEGSVCEKRAKNDNSKSKRHVAESEVRGSTQGVECAKKVHTTSLTPYAVRQKLLQLRLEAEEIGRMKPGRKLYGALEKSCALRYQETY